MTHTTARRARRAMWQLASLVVVLWFGWPSGAAAGGLWLHDHGGARAVGRGFALIAGADDAAAIFYNPAGLVEVERALHASARLALVSADFSRVDSGGRTLPTVTADPLPVPVPTLAYADALGLGSFTFAIGLTAPGASLLRWPDGRDAAQRYTLVSLEGTLLVEPTLGVAWQTPVPGLSIGLSPGLVVGSFQARLALSACDGVACMLPENPDYDALAELRAAPIVRPRLKMGVRYARSWIVLGAFVSTPYELGQEADLRVRLPSAAIFSSATLSGDRARYTLTIPWSAGAGIELRPAETFRVELAGVVETWSQQQEVLVGLGGLRIEGPEIVGDYELRDQALSVRMRDVVSARLGLEYDAVPNLLSVRAGGYYEPSAFDDAHRSVLTVDGDKWFVGLGASLKLGELWFDAAAGHTFIDDLTVTDTEVNQINPVRPALSTVPVGNGTYRQTASVLAVGLRWVPKPR